MYLFFTELLLLLPNLEGFLIALNLWLDLGAFWLQNVSMSSLLHHLHILVVEDFDEFETISKP